jgi:hypothetical protein
MPKDGFPVIDATESVHVASSEQSAGAPHDLDVRLRHYGLDYRRVGAGVVAVVGACFN